MYLPSKYVPLFLDSSGYTMKQVSDILPAVLAQDRNVSTCCALLNWLRVTSHGTLVRNAQDQPAVGSPVTAITLIAPAVDKDLILHRTLALKATLTGLGKGQGGTVSHSTLPGLSPL